MLSVELVLKNPLKPAAESFSKLIRQLKKIRLDNLRIKTNDCINTKDSLIFNLMEQI